MHGRRRYKHPRECTTPEAPKWASPKRASPKRTSPKRTPLIQWNHPTAYNIAPDERICGLALRTLLDHCAHSTGTQRRNVLKLNGKRMDDIEFLNQCAHEMDAFSLASNLRRIINALARHGAVDLVNQIEAKWKEVAKCTIAETIAKRDLRVLTSSYGWRGIGKRRRTQQDSERLLRCFRLNL